MKILIEIRVHYNSKTHAPFGVADYTLTKTIEMPQLPPQNVWLTFGPDGQALTFNPDKWELDWFDEKHTYRIVVRLLLTEGESDYDEINERLTYFRKTWTEEPQGR